MEIKKLTQNELYFIPALCLDPSVGKEGKEFMAKAMDKRIEWIKEMMKKGLELLIALEDPRDEIINYKWVGKIKHSDLAVHGKVPMGLLEYIPIEHALEPLMGKNSLFINCMWILPPFWKGGVADTLITKFLDNAREIGSASLVAYNKVKWFDTSIEYMPLEFFKRYGFTEVDRDEERVLLFLDFENIQSPKFIQSKFKIRPGNQKVKLNIFCNHQCPWSTYMVKEVQEGLKLYDNIDLTIISTNEKKTIEESGISRGVLINNKVIFKRMVTWDQVKKKIDEIKLT